MRHAHVPVARFRPILVAVAIRPGCHQTGWINFQLEFVGRISCIQQNAGEVRGIDSSTGQHGNTVDRGCAQTARGGHQCVSADSQRRAAGNKDRDRVAVQSDRAGNRQRRTLGERTIRAGLQCDISRNRAGAAQRSAAGHRHVAGTRSGAGGVVHVQGRAVVDGRIAGVSIGTRQIQHAAGRYALNGQRAGAAVANWAGQGHRVPVQAQRGTAGIEGERLP